MSLKRNGSKKTIRRGKEFDVCADIATWPVSVMLQPPETANTRKQNLYKPNSQQWNAVVDTGTSTFGWQRPSQGAELRQTCLRSDISVFAL